MDEKRAKTLEALSAFIESQRALLSRTQVDVERLKELRDDIDSTTEFTPDCLREQLNQGRFHLDEYDYLAVTIAKDVEWSLYKSQDPSPFRTLASDLRRAQSQRNQPSSFQKSELSDLQKLVKESRQRIVDPVLTRLAADLQYAISSDEEEPMDPEEIKRDLERENIRQLKRRKINSALTISGRRVPMTSGVFIRRDQDESADVDVTMHDAVAETVEVDPPLVLPVHVLAPVVPKGPRGTRNARKSDPRPPEKPKKEQKRKPPKEQPKSKRDGPKSDTYKQTWTIEEQHHLEQLLEDIPVGEKNRWAKISQAMNGRRTPRQVASRVQKYFEKLKKFGVDVDE